MVKLFRGQMTYNALRKRAAPWLNNQARELLTKRFLGAWRVLIPDSAPGDFVEEAPMAYVLMTESCVMH